MRHDLPLQRPARASLLAIALACSLLSACGSAPQSNPQSGPPRVVERDLSGSAVAVSERGTPQQQQRP